MCSENNAERECQLSEQICDPESRDNQIDQSEEKEKRTFKKAMHFVGLLGITTGNDIDQMVDRLFLVKCVEKEKYNGHDDKHDMKQHPNQQSKSVRTK